MKNGEANGQYSKIEVTSQIKGDIVSEADFRIDGSLEGSSKNDRKTYYWKRGENYRRSTLL